MTGPLFELGDGCVIPTDHCRGPWDPAFLHGGPVCGLAAWAAERVVGPDAGMMCARLTVEILAPVPLAPLRVSSEVVKPGHRVRSVDVTIVHDDRTVARASSQWAIAGPDAAPRPGATTPPPLPDVVAEPDDGDFEYPRPGFNCDAVELRIVSGSTEESGPGIMWHRLLSPLVAGEPTSPFAAVATLSDLAAATAWQYSPNGTSFINSDVTMQLTRLPIDGWLCLDAANEAAGHGIGLNHAVMYDRVGPVGRILQTLVESPIQLRLE